MRRWKWLLIVPVLAAVVTSVLVVHLVPVRYESESTLMLARSKISADLVPQLSSGALDDMRLLTAKVLSRTRLERVIDEYGLYKDDRDHAVMADIVEGMRHDIQISATDAPGPGGAKVVKVGFRSTDPKIAQEVATDLTAFLIAERASDQANVAAGTLQFLDAEIENTRGQLQAFETAHGAATRAESRPVAIEREVLEDTYRSLLAKRQSAKIAEHLETRQYGDRLLVFDLARIPERPVGLTRTQLTVAGMLSGLVVGFVIVGVSSRKSP
jgi:uncharacterized protein involved in exopolysaccharide biosynthesis